MYWGAWEYEVGKGNSLKGYEAMVASDSNVKMKKIEEDYQVLVHF